MSALKKGSLTSLSQLDEFNKEVLAFTDSELAQYLSQRSESIDTVSPAEIAAIGDETTTDTDSTTGRGQVA